MNSNKLASQGFYPQIILAPILVVEDSRPIQLIYQYFLRKLGFQSKLVASGQQALNCIARRHYHAIILDIGLPDINGEVVIERIRVHEKNTPHHIPIIVTTAQGNQRILAGCKKKGADAALMKPVALLTLQQTFRSLDLMTRYQQSR